MIFLFGMIYASWIAVSVTRAIRSEPTPSMTTRLRRGLALLLCLLIVLMAITAEVFYWQGRPEALPLIWATQSLGWFIPPLVPFELISGLDMVFALFGAKKVIADKSGPKRVLRGYRRAIFWGICSLQVTVGVLAAYVAGRAALLVAEMP